MNYGRLSKAAAAWVLLLIAGCQSSPPPGWQYDGADPANTRFISVWGPALRSGWQWRRAWQAEDFLPLQFQLNPLTRNLEYRVLTADIDGDAEQEIALAAPGGMSGILDCHGVLRRAFDAGERLSSLNADEPGPLSPVTCGPGEVRIYQPSLLPGPDSAGAGLFRSVTTEGTPVQAELLGESGNRAARKRSDSGASDPDPELLVTVEHGATLPGRDGIAAQATSVCGYSPDHGGPVWRFETGASLCRIWAVSDVNGDTQPELIVGTYGYEHGLCINGIADTGRAYVLCLDRDGRQLWQTEFAGAEHMFTQTLARDLDQDSIPEVVVAAGNWRRDFGSLAVLDGRTGRVRARYPESGSYPCSFTSLAAADLDQDDEPEICAASSGSSAQAWIFRFRTLPDRLETARGREFAGEVEQDFTNLDIWALADFDGDRDPEMLLSCFAERQVDDDPYFYASRITDAHLVVLDRDLKECNTIRLGSAPGVVAVSALAGQSKPGILVLTDRLEYYEPR